MWNSAFLQLHSRQRRPERFLRDATTNPSTKPIAHAQRRCSPSHAEFTLASPEHPQFPSASATIEWSCDNASNTKAPSLAIECIGLAVTTSRPPSAAIGATAKSIERPLFAFTNKWRNTAKCYWIESSTDYWMYVKKWASIELLN